MPKTEQDLKQITLRLFEDDIEEVKRRADNERMPWQLKLRMILHEALNKPERAVLK